MKYKLYEESVYEDYELSMVSSANAVVYPRAMVIEDLNAWLANLTMLGSFRFNDLAIRTDYLVVFLVCLENVYKITPFLFQIPWIRQPWQEEECENNNEQGDFSDQKSRAHLVWYVK